MLPGYAEIFSRISGCAATASSLRRPPIGVVGPPVAEPAAGGLGAPGIPMIGGTPGRGPQRPLIGIACTASLTHEKETLGASRSVALATVK